MVRKVHHVNQNVGQIRVLTQDPLKDLRRMLTSLTVVLSHMLAQRSEVGCRWVQNCGSRRVREPVVPGRRRWPAGPLRELPHQNSGKCLAQEFQHRRLLRIQFFDEPTKSAAVATGLGVWSDGQGGCRTRSWTR